MIARRIGPLPEIVAQAGGGELFDQAGDLNEIVRRFRGDPSHGRRLGDNGREAFRANWSESAVIPRYLQIIQKAAEVREDRAILEKLRPGN